MLTSSNGIVQCHQGVTFFYNIESVFVQVQIQTLKNKKTLSHKGTFCDLSCQDVFASDFCSVSRCLCNCTVFVSVYLKAQSPCREISVKPQEFYNTIAADEQ